MYCIIFVYVHKHIYTLLATFFSFNACEVWTEQFKYVHNTHNLLLIELIIFNRFSNSAHTVCIENILIISVWIVQFCLLFFINILLLVLICFKKNYNFSFFFRILPHPPGLCSTRREERRRGSYPSGSRYHR